MTITPHFPLTIVLLSATLYGVVLTERRSPETLVRPLSSVPSLIDGWRSGGDQKLRATIVASLDATEYVSRTYAKGDDALDMFAAFYAQQRAGESMHSPKYCLPGGGWEFSEVSVVPVQLPNNTVSINRVLIQKPGSRALVFYWYQSRNRVVASEYESKAFLVWDSLLHANPGGSIVRVMLPDRPQAAEEGLAFSTKLLNEMQKCFRAQ